MQPISESATLIGCGSRHRSFLEDPSMFRSLLCAAILCAVVLSGLIFSPNAQACPVKIPETLLALYRNSKEIHVARFDKKLLESVNSNEKEYSILNVKYFFDISSTLKGESRKMFTYSDTEYRYRSNENEPVDEFRNESIDSSSLKAGDLVLLFLKEEEPDEGEADPADRDKKPELVLTDYRDGLKQVKDSELSVYETRINELNKIFASEKEDNAAVLQWLIRCIEDPLTRWDGAFDLNSSFLMKEHEDEAAKAGEDGAEDRFYYLGEGTRNSQYARLMTDAQKQAVTNILISAPTVVRSQEEKENGLSRGDYALIQLVTRWADSKVAGYLLERLRTGRDDRWDVSSIMNSISDILDDKDVEAASDAYAEALSGDDDEIVSGSEEDDAEEAVVGDRPADPENKSESRDKSEDTPESSEIADAAVQKITYLELRAALLAKFISAADMAIANPKAEEPSAEN